jgi:hypothetical protein
VFERSPLLAIVRPASGLALFPSLRAAEDSPLRAFMVLVLAELAGGVMRLTADREVTPAAGWAADRLAFAPKLAARVLGLASTWLVDSVFLSWFIWLDESFISLP